MNEVILAMGPSGRLIATMTPPPSGAPARSTAMLLLNAGVIHRMGPHRINVKLARHLAALGFPVLRLDLSGQGDSRPAEGNLPFEQQAVVDIKTAMNHLQQLMQVESFALAGICSGAYHGVATALEDERLTALWLMDTHAYATPKTAWVRARRQLQLEPAGTLLSWAGKVLGRLLPKDKASGTAAPMVDADDDTPYPTPTKAAFAQRLKTLLDRRVRLQIVYTGSWFWRYNHASQWRDAFKDHGAVADIPCELLSDVDHTAATLHAQRRLIESVTRFSSRLS